MKVKKILSLVLAMLLVVSVFAGCGGGNSSKPASNGSDSNEIDFDSEPYTVNYMYMVASEGANQQKVNEAVDALARKELNMTVNMMPMTWGTYATQIPMMLASAEPLDIFLGSSGSFATYIESQYILNLNDYLPQLKDAKEVLGDDFEAATVGDFLCGTSQMKERAYQHGFVIRKDIFDELGYKEEDFSITTDDFSSFQQLTDMFADVKAHYPDIVVYDGSNTNTMTAYDSFTDGFGDPFGVLENYGQDTTVKNWYESDQFKGMCHVMKDWFDAGYVSKDIAVSTDSGEVKMKAGNSFCFSTHIKPNTNVEKEAQTGYPIAVVPISDKMKNTAAVSAIVFCIANQAEDPVKAAQFLNWTHISREFNDLINWGIEGEDWVETEEGLAAYPDGVDASNVGYHQDYGWAYPNQFAGHPWTGNPTDIWEQYAEFNGSLLKSKAFGFMFDSTPVVNEMAQLTSVRDQYVNDISTGVLADLDAKIDEFNNAMYAAGLQAVIDEKQRQFDEWYAEQ